MTKIPVALKAERGILQIGIDCFIQNVKMVPTHCLLYRLGKFIRRHIPLLGNWFDGGGRVEKGTEQVQVHNDETDQENSEQDTTQF